MDNQQGPTVSTGDFALFSDNLNGKRTWLEVYTCTCITESLCVIPETTTTLLINSIPIK